MNSRDALDFVDQLIYAQTSKYLSDLERDIFLGSWNGKTYGEIYPANPEYVEKYVGYKLWQKISSACGEKVTKKQLRGAIARAWQRHMGAGQADDLQATIPEIAAGQRHLPELPPEGAMQILSMLHQVMSAQEFDQLLHLALWSILEQMRRSLQAGRATLFVFDEKRFLENQDCDHRCDADLIKNCNYNFDHNLNLQQSRVWSIVAAHGYDDLPNLSSHALRLCQPSEQSMINQIICRQQTVNIPYNCDTDLRLTTIQLLDQYTHKQTDALLAMPLLNSTNELMAVLQFVNKLGSVSNSATPELGGEPSTAQSFTLADEQQVAVNFPLMQILLERFGWRDRIHKS